MHVTFLGKLEWGIAQIVTKAMVGSECESVGGGIVCIRLMRALLPGGVTCHLLDTNNDSPLLRDAGRGHAWNVAAVCGVCIIVHCPENPGCWESRAGGVVCSQEIGLVYCVCAGMRWLVSSAWWRGHYQSLHLH